MKKRENKTEKDREATEKRLLEAVGEIIEEKGFEHVGINAVAAKADVSKMLIYRYFGSIEELIAQYIAKNDYWINTPTELPTLDKLNDYLKSMFRNQIKQLRDNEIINRLYRWELNSNNPIVNELREKREINGTGLVEAVSRLTGTNKDDVASIATLITAAISYLAILEQQWDVYNGIKIQTDEGWEKLAVGIDNLIDLWTTKIKQ